MERMLKMHGGAIGVMIIIAFGLNNFFGISTAEKDWGIVEHWILGRSLMDIFAPPWSDNYRHWDAASKAGLIVADLIHKNGIADLAQNPDLIKERDLARRKSEEAYKHAAAIPQEYLAKSNPDLPKVYFESFVPAMDFLNRGFSAGNLQMAKQGVSAYNDFLVWVQSRDRSEFKPLR
jgi:hypothetical protein